MYIFQEKFTKLAIPKFPEYCAVFLSSLIFL